MAALKILFPLLFVFSLSSSGWALKSHSEDLLWGRWNFFGFYYKGKEMAPINPKLRIQFEFKPPKSAWLKYWREDEQGFCERLALFEWLHDQLYQKVVWLNPENRSDCAKDPDMQMNTQSWSPMDVDETELNLVLPLGNEKLTYRFRKKAPDKKTTAE